MSKPKVVIFDLWQTLVNAREKPSDLFNLYLKDLRVCDSEQFLRLLLRSYVFLADAPIEVTLKRFLNGLGVSDQGITANCVNYWKLMALGNFIIPGVEELLTSLKRCGFRLCLLTNSDKYGYENANIESILALFDFSVISYQVGYAKPDTRCWDIIRNHFRVSFSDMLMVGDSAFCDIMPAEKLGIQVMQVGAAGAELSGLAKSLCA